MLGDQITKEEIDDIIREVAGDGGKISYAAFLAQWDDCELTTEQRMVREVTVNESTDQISVLSSEGGSDHGEPASGTATARANFIEQKHISERKLGVQDLPMPELKIHDSARRVMFQDEADSVIAEE